MLTTAGKFAEELRKLIEEEYCRVRDNLAGGSAKSFDEYQRSTGYIAALKTVTELMEVAQTNAEKR
jgi:hypothetical protein